MTSEPRQGEWGTRPATTLLGSAASLGGAVLASGLRHSRMFAIAVHVYQFHRVGLDGRCLRCATHNCRHRRHALKIIVAAGAEPRDFEACRHAPTRAARRAIALRVARRRPATAIPRLSWRDMATVGPRLRHGHARRARRSARKEVRTTMARPSPAPSTDPFTLRGLLYCAGCQLPLHPLRLAGGPRAYRGPCGCRLRPLDALAVERRVRQAVEQQAGAQIAGLPDECLAAAYRQFIAEARIDATGDELTIVWLV
jgi:hypothetical protein